MMQTVGLTERILTTLKGLIEHHSSSRCVAEQMGQAHNYVARILRGETKLRLDVLERILETLGIPHHLFIQMVIAGQPSENDAAELLRFLSGGRKPDGTYLSDIEPTLDVLLRMPLRDDAGFPRSGDEIDRLEALRRSDKDGAEKGLEALIFALLTDPPVPVPRELLEDLAIALATYGSVQRLFGRRVDAAFAFQSALRVGSRSERPAGLGHAFRKAAFLLRDFGYADTSIRFLETAREYFLRDGDTARCFEIFADRGSAWISLGEYEKSICDYSTALRRLPADDHVFRYAAHLNIAHCHEQLGRLPEALAELEQASALHGGQEDMALSFLVWNRANLAAAVGETAVAGEEYRRAIDLLARFSEPVDVALCALDLAGLLISVGEPKAVQQLSEEVLAWLPAFRGSRVADAVMTELIRCAKWGELTSQFLDGARQRLQHVRGS